VIPAFAVRGIHVALLLGFIDQRHQARAPARLPGCSIAIHYVADVIDHD
jgi:hypothetical protein